MSKELNELIRAVEEAAWRADLPLGEADDAMRAARKALKEYYRVDHAKGAAFHRRAIIAEGELRELKDSFRQVLITIEAASPTHEIAAGVAASQAREALRLKQRR